MRYETKLSRLSFLPEFKELVCKCLGSMKCDGYIIGFNNYGGKSELVIYDINRKEVANLGDIFEFIENTLQEADLEKGKITYTLILSLVQKVLDHYKEKIEELTKKKVIHLFPNRLSYLILIRAFLKLIAKVENKKVSIDIDKNTVKINGEEVYCLNYDLVSIDSLLENLFYDFVKIVETRLRN